MIISFRPRLILAIMWMTFTANVYAESDICSSDIKISAGYRNDEVRTLIGSENPKGFTFLTDSLKAEDIRVWEIGVRGRWFLPMWDYDCWWLSCFYVRGAAFIGRVREGDYRDEASQRVCFLGDSNCDCSNRRSDSSRIHHGSNSSSSSSYYRHDEGGGSSSSSSSSSSSECFIPIFHAKADIDEGKTRDFNVGLGWLFPVYDCFSIGPVAGWSYDYMRFKMSHAETNGFPNHILDGLKYRSVWKGPWVGVDTIFTWCDWRFAAGYEFHWGTWRGSWDLRGHDVGGCGSFSDTRKGNDAHGQLVYFDGDWMFCDSWVVGVGLKYQFWKIKDGTEKPRNGSFKDIGCAATEFDRIRDTKWRSWGVALDVGYIF